MDIQTLEAMYSTASSTDDFEIHSTFVRELLKSQDNKVLDYHYKLLADQSNRDLYLRIRLGMVKRGKSVAPFLIHKLQRENNLSLRRDLLHILGRLRVPDALKLARKEIEGTDADMRHRSCHVIGWMGDSSDIPRLRKALLIDTDEYVRRTAATSHSQIGERIPELVPVLMLNLRQALQSEKSEEVIKWIVITVQYLSKKRFGLREDIDEGIVIGEVEPAKQRCLRFLATLP